MLQATRVNFLGARGIEAVVTIDHTRGNQASLSWLLYDGHGNLVRTMVPNYTLSSFQWRGVWGEVQGSLGTGRGYCANLGHPEDETGLVYMRARYYEPATGRFISEDPARDGVNWYLYADGNPVNKVDYEEREAVVDPFWRLICNVALAIYGTLAFFEIGWSTYVRAISAVLAWAGQSLRVARVTVAAASFFMRAFTHPAVAYAAYGLTVLGIGLGAATVVVAIAALHSFAIAAIWFFLFDQWSDSMDRQMKEAEKPAS